MLYYIPVRSMRQTGSAMEVDGRRVWRKSHIWCPWLPSSSLSLASSLRRKQITSHLWEIDLPIRRARGSIDNVCSAMNVLEFVCLWFFRICYMQCLYIALTIWLLCVSCRLTLSVFLSQKCGNILCSLLMFAHCGVTLSCSLCRMCCVCLCGLTL